MPMTKPCTTDRPAHAFRAVPRSRGERLGVTVAMAALLGCSGGIEANDRLEPGGSPVADGDRAGSSAAGRDGATAGSRNLPPSGPDATPDMDPGAAGAPAAEPGTCSPSNASPVPLFATPAPAPPIVERRADGTIVTRGAGRVRGRHELEGTYSPFGPLYFENRSYGFTIEDSVAAGGGEIRFTYLPEAPVSTNGAQTNFRYFKIYGDGNVFHSNVTMERVTLQELVYTVDSNSREGRPLATGDVLEFEFGIFIAGNAAGDPGAIEGRNSYYTDTFRYRVGQGGLTAHNDDTSGTPGPGDDARLAGDTTIPWIYAEPELYFSQMALNMQPEHVQAFLRGRRLFHTDFGSGEHSEDGNPVFDAQAGKLGPLSSAPRCASCHERDGRGQPPAPGQTLASMVVKLYGGGELGDQLQQQEGEARLERYEQHEVELADGTVVMLERPLFTFEGADGAALSPSIRVARQNPGVGLLEAIPEAQILARADEGDCNLDGVTGRARLVPDPDGGERMRLGRFGWKAEKVSVAHQVADALQADHGVSTRLFPEPDGSAELDDADFGDLVTYAQLLALPARRDADDPHVQRGQTLFTQIGCVRCHAPDATTGTDHPLVELRDQEIHPYTDLLLHDMGEDLADGSGSAEAREWRTAPLWGLGLIETVSGHGRLLHDGRAQSPLHAVLWHGGEAAFARAAVIELSAEDREALLAFLQSL
jgi:CxxC motif-containing protein (DUF1111 family)